MIIDKSKNYTIVANGQSNKRDGKLTKEGAIYIYTDVADGRSDIT